MGRFKHVTFISIIFLAACVTVNIYFPAAAIQKVADEIVDDVRGTKDQQKPEEKKDLKSRLFENFRGLGLGSNEAWAQISIEVSTPAIRNYKQALKDNFRLLKPFYENGNVGENSTGLVDTRDTGGLSLKEKSQLTQLVEQQNSNRTALYKEILKANKLQSQALPEVQKVFANSWREKSLANWWIQNDKGEWEKKR